MRHGSPLQLGESRLQLAGHPADIVARADDIGTIQGLVASGLGVAIVPRMLLTVRHPGVAICTFAEPVEPRRVGIAWRAGPEPAVSLRLVVDTAVAALAPAAHAGRRRRLMAVALDVLTSVPDMLGEGPVYDAVDRRAVPDRHHGARRCGAST